MEESVAVGSAAAGGGIWLIFNIAISVLIIASMWKIFTKAGQPGWAAIIPIYNAYVLLKVAGKPGWWLILMLIPIVNIVVSILMLVGITTNFGKGGGFVVGMIFLPIIFYPMLAFGSAEYQQAEVVV